MSGSPVDDGALPWPRRNWHNGREVNLDTYIPAQWHGCEPSWRYARSAIAKSLGRRCLPELQAALRATGNGRKVRSDD
jgi:hypothetical protein